MPREFALPGTKPRYAPDRQATLKHIRLDLELEPGRRRVRGTCTLTLAVVAEGTRWLRLDAVELDVSRVVCAGATLPFSSDGAVLSVDCGRMLASGSEVTLEIDYQARPRRGLYFVGPDEAYPDKPEQVWSQGQDEDSRHWFPCIDSPREKATSEVIATVPARFTVVSNGTRVSDELRGEQRRVHWRFDTPHAPYLVTLVAGEFTELREQWEDVVLRTCVQKGREEEARRTLARTGEMLELLGRLLGVRYPYEQYAQVFVADFIFGGMENTTATTLTDVILLDERAALDCDFEALVVHELAHQWFGNLLTCRSWSEGWLNEGFATYAEYLWREHADGEDAAALELAQWGEQYFREDAERYRRTVATNLYDAPIDIFDHHLYEKGARVLHMLRRLLGDGPFFAALRHYLCKHRTGTVETRDLSRAIEESTGRTLDWFFDQWITRGAGHPELEVSAAWDAEHRLLTVTVKQTQAGDGKTPLFRLPTRLRVRTGGEERDLALELEEAQHSFCFQLDAAPTQVIFDPGKPLLARIKVDKPLACWLAELAGARHAADRSDAARALGSHGGAGAREALAQALASDPFWGVQAEAATALGRLADQGSRDILLAALPTAAHPRVRRSVVRALGEFRGDAAAADALAALVLRGDPSYFVEAEACLALGRTRSPRASAVLRRAVDRPSFLEVIRQHAYQGLAAARDDSAVDLLLAASERGAPSHARRGAVMSLAELVKGRRDRDAIRVRERLEQLLDDRDFRLQSTAIEALALLGDPACIAALERLAERDLDGRLRRRAREIVRDLREERGQGEELRVLRDELSAAQHELRELSARLTQLETRAGADAPGPAEPPSTAPPRKRKKRTAASASPGSAATRRRGATARPAASGVRGRAAPTEAKPRTRGGAAAATARRSNPRAGRQRA
jgi:aminopeptidase N